MNKIRDKDIQFLLDIEIPSDSEVFVESMMIWSTKMQL